MRGVKKTLLVLGALYIIIGIIFTGIFIGTSRGDNTSNVAVNRINSELSSAVSEGEDIAGYVEKNMPRWQEIYGDACPVSIDVTPFSGKPEDTVFLDERGISVCGIYGADGELLGFARYTCKVGGKWRQLIIIAALAAVSFVISGAVVVYVHKNIITPFRTLSDYPERLARLHTIDRLPETKQRYFGKYVWGMNMLCDMMEQNRKQIGRLEADKRTLLASLAHNVKTPVANIRLYAQAMEMGMYKSREEFTEAADRIESNCVKLEKLTAEMLDTAATAVSAYEPETDCFYLKELADMTEREFSNRLTVRRIPYTVDIEENIIVNSDKWAIFRAMAQLMENAMKYGSGEGISVSLFKEDGELCISVRNKGELLPESELPYVFKSYWRGSNAADVEGSGIGLYTAREVLKVLGGNIFARRLEDTSEMEFVICLELDE